MSNPKNFINRIVRVTSSEEPYNDREMRLAEAIDAAWADLGDIISGEIVFRSEDGREYTFTFDDNE